MHVFPHAYSRSLKEAFDLSYSYLIIVILLRLGYSPHYYAFHPFLFYINFVYTGLKRNIFFIPDNAVDQRKLGLF